MEYLEIANEIRKQNKHIEIDTEYLHRHLVALKNGEIDIFDKLNGQLFTIKDLNNISYRTVNYWDEKGLLIGDIERFRSEGWRRFSFIEFVWIEILNSLRELGVSVDSAVSSIFKAFNYIPVSHKELDIIPEEATRVYGNYREFLSTFKTYLLCATIMKNTVLIRVYSDGSSRIVRIDETDSKLENIAFDYKENKRSFLSISINEIIERFLISKDIKVIESVGILNENEIELLKCLKKNDVEEIKIVFEDKKPILIETTHLHNYVENNKRLYEYITSPYEEITFKTFGTKTVSFKRITKTKLKK